MQTLARLGFLSEAAPSLTFDDLIEKTAQRKPLAWAMLLVMNFAALSLQLLLF